MELDILKLHTTWNDAANSINTNFSKIQMAIASLGTGGGGLNEDELRAFLVVYLTQNGYATKDDIDNAISDIINGAPSTLDTLKEIADALAESDDIIAALNNAIGTKASKDELNEGLNTLANSKITISGVDVSLGGEITQQELRTGLGLENLIDWYNRVGVAFGKKGDGTYFVDGDFLANGQFAAAAVGAEGGGSVGAAYLADLYDVSLGSLLSGDILSWNGSEWVNIKQSSIVPDLSAYATKNFVTSQGYIKDSALAPYIKESVADGRYATIVSLGGVDSRLAIIEKYFSTSDDADNQINKWNEIVAFLDSTEGTTLEGILSAYATKSFVTDSLVGYATQSDVTSALSNYLPKTGGSISGLLKIEKSGPYIGFRNYDADNSIAYFGYDRGNTWYVTDPDFAKSYTLIHSGNIGSQSVASAQSLAHSNGTVGATVTYGGNVLINTGNDDGKSGKLLVGGGVTLRGYAPSGSISNLLDLNGVGLVIGIDPLRVNWGMGMWTEDNGHGYIQQQAFNESGTTYPLGLNPFGGNVLIGTMTNSGYKLDVAGDVRVGSLSTPANLTVCGNTRVYRRHDDRTYLDLILEDVVVNYEAYDTDGFCKHKFKSNGKDLMLLDGSSSIATFYGSISAPSVVVANEISINGIRIDTYNGVLRINGDVFSTGQFAASLVGQEGGGGGVMLLTSWPSASGDYSGYALGGNLGVELNDRVKTLEGKATAVSFSQTLTSGKEIGTLTIDGVAKSLYAPSMYDWSEINAKPTKLSQFTDDVVAGKYLSLSGGTISGQLNVTNINGYTPIHSGNIGSYNAGSADVIAKTYANENINYNGNESRIRLISGYASNSKDLGFPTQYVSGISVLTNYTGWQMLSYASSAVPNPYYRAFYDNGARSDWKKLAFLDDNVASATKLATPRTIWGQPFDGTGDIPMTSIATMLYVYFRNSAGTGNAGYVGRGSASNNIELMTYGNDSLILGTSTKYRFILNYSGNVTIGASDLAGTSAKLYVDGGIRFAPRTIWGQSFDGTGNVSGTLSGVTNINSTLYINSSGNVTIGSQDLAGVDYKFFVESGIASQHFLQLTPKENVYSTITALETGMVLNSVHNNVRVLPIMLATNGGNVLIGTDQDRGAKLYVNGTFRCNALRTSSSAVTYWGISDEGILSWDTTYASVMAKSGLALRLGIDGTPYITIASNGAISMAGAVTMSSTLSVGGNILIGTTTDSGYKLDVNGTLRVTDTLTAQNGITTNEITIGGVRLYVEDGALKINGNVFATGQFAAGA